MNARTIPALVISVAVAGCGGGGGGGNGGSNGGGNPPVGTTVTVTFSSANGAPMPNVVATSGGALSTWTVAPVNGGLVQFTLPPGVTGYGVAYYCQNSESIVELSTNDTMKPSLSCFGPASTTNVTFGYDVSQIAGATHAEIDVANASMTTGSGPQPPTGSYTFTSPMTLPAGTVDVMLKALDNSGDVLGLHITRGMALTSGSTYPLSPLTSSETTTSQALSAANVPAGWTTAYSGGLVLSDGSRFSLPSTNGFYAVPPASQVQLSDYYAASALASPANNASTTAALVTAQAPPASVSLPQPFSYAGPAAADDPAFVFNYSGAFNVTGTVLYQATMQWSANSLSVTATKAAVGSNPSIVIPKLNAISPLFPNLPSGGTNVTWGAYAIDESTLVFGSVTPVNFNAQFTWSQGNYIAP